MFRNACTAARGFTLPVVISQRLINGKCSAVVGSCIVLNGEGWILTAGHIVSHIGKVVEEENRSKDAEAKLKEIEDDQGLTRSERRARAKEVQRSLPGSQVSRCSAWFGHDGCRLLDASVLSGADLGVGRLDPFDPAWIPAYPVIKNPKIDFEPGTSLCRMGFPFHQIEPTWDDAAQGFHLPLDGPMAYFPNEGIFTRTAQIVVLNQNGVVNNNPAPFPLQMIETSSPGIPGQSGGPIFDTAGRIWGIQSSTTSYRLSLNTKEQQYLNVGLGIHPETIIGLLKLRNVKFEVSVD